MVFSKQNQKYVPSIYFNITPKTGESYIAVYSNEGVWIIRIDSEGNVTDEISRIGPSINLMHYLSNKGFTQLPRDSAKPSIDEALGKYAQEFWTTFLNGNGQFMTDKPFKAAWQYVTDSPHEDISFRFTYDNGNTRAVMNVVYR